MAVDVSEYWLPWLKSVSATQLPVATPPELMASTTCPIGVPVAVAVGVLVEVGVLVFGTTVPVFVGGTKDGVVLVGVLAEVGVGPDCDIISMTLMQALFA